MDDATSEVHRVFGKLSLDEDVRPFDLVVRDLQHGTRLADQRLAHLDGGGARLGIDADDVRDADDEVAIAHHLAEQYRRNLGEGHRPPLAAPAEADRVERQARDLGGRAVAVAEARVGDDAELVEGLRHLVPGVPAPVAPQGVGLRRVHLLAGVAVGRRSVGLLLLGDDVQFTEDLLERLHALRLEAVGLPLLPVAVAEKVVRMGDPQHLVGPRAGPIT